MKQTKKLTRHHRELLARKKISTEGVRLIEDNGKTIKILLPDDSRMEISKKGR